MEGAFSSGEGDKITQGGSFRTVMGSAIISRVHDIALGGVVEGGLTAVPIWVKYDLNQPLSAEINYRVVT